MGFRSVWQLDYTRTYNMTFDDKTTYALEKAPRPILVNIWYPAKKAGKAKAMLHRDYLNIHSQAPRLSRFADKLAQYNYAVLAKEIMGRTVKELTTKEKHLLDEFLNTATACSRDAAPADGAFPIVIYHSGFGSSFEDNSILCEFLASHGFVVFGSAYQEPSGSPSGDHHS